MTSNLHSYFGLEIKVNRDIDSTIATRFRQALSGAINRLDPAKRSKLRLYIHHLVFRWKRLHFQVTADQRVGELSILIEPCGKTAKRYLRFANADLGISANPPAVQVRASSSRIGYQLPEPFLNSHDEYADYIATILLPKCPESDRKLIIRVTATATEVFRPHLQTARPTQTTKIPFPLDRRIEIPT